MNVVFVNMYDFKNLFVNSIPLGILSLATTLKDNKDFNVKVLDFNRIYENKILNVTDNIDENITNAVNYILKYKPNVVAMYTMCNTHAFSIMFAKLIKLLEKEITIMLGGPHATLTAEDTLKEFPFIDLIGLSEGERTIEQILYGIKNKELSAVNGICYRRNNNIELKNNVELIENLDELPILDYSLLEFNLNRNIGIEVGRGCPYQCIFCSTKEFWERKFRLKSNKRIYQEILHYKSKYGINDFAFYHDLFTLNKERVLEICKMFIEKKLHITWGCSSRVDTIDADMIKAMAESGCNLLYFGVETGSARMQKLIKKNLKLDIFLDLIRTLKKYEIKPIFSFIYGFPQEKAEDVDDTLQLVYMLYEEYRGMPKEKKATFQLHKLAFFPRTELTNNYIHLLEYEENYLTGVGGGDAITKWHSEELNEIVRRKNIFPQYYTYKNEIQGLLKNLDFYFAYFFIKIIGNLDMTYKLILDYFSGEHIQIYLAFNKVLNKENEGLWWTKYETTKLSTHETILVFGKFIKKYDFRSEKAIIREMYELESSFLNFLSNSNKDDHEFTLEKIYNYDVYRMKKNRCNEKISRRNILRLLNSKNKPIVEQQYI